MFCALLMTRPITSAGSCCTELCLIGTKPRTENVRGFFIVRKGTLDFSKMAAVVDGAYRAVIGM